MIREQIRELEKLGQMPDDSSNEDPSIDVMIDQYEELLGSISKPITFEEGEILIKLFPETTFYGLEWTLLHLIESLFKQIDFDKYENLLKKCPSIQWKETLLDRLKM